MAGRLNFAPDEATRVDQASALELCRTDCLSASSCFRKADQIREQKKFRRGVWVDQVWSDLFSTFVSQFGLMTVVDRFCLQRLAESARGESGFEQWLARVDASDCGNS